MSAIVTVFQFEIRYNHILNFSQIARGILAPYVKLSQSLKMDKQDTVEERIILNFENENYYIIVSWDRILIKGQGNISKYFEKNSPLQFPFIDILNKLKELPQFGSIQNILFAINYIKKYNIPKEEMTSRFMDGSILKNTKEILDGVNDIAIALEKKESGDETYLTYGPYFGSNEITTRPIVPINIDALTDVDFTGIMVEYKHMITTNSFVHSDFEKMVKDSSKLINKVWTQF